MATILERKSESTLPYNIPLKSSILNYVSKKPSGQSIGEKGGVSMFTLIAGAITAGATIGGMVGGAFATAAGTSVTTGTAVGTIAGAGVGLAAGMAEAGNMLLERCGKEQPLSPIPLRELRSHIVR